MHLSVITSRLPAFSIPAMPTARPQASRPLGLIAIVLWLLGAFVWQPQQAQAQRPPKANPKVDMEILADRSATAPGDTFRVGIQFKIEPQWHIYWENYGDAGIATEVAWTLPEGVTAGPLRWQTPVRFEEGGGSIITYGYHDEAILWTELSVAKDFAEKELKLKAKADWLICREVCIPGSGTLEGSIPLAEKEKQASPEALLSAIRHTAKRLETPADAGVRASLIEVNGESYPVVQIEVDTAAFLAAIPPDERRALDKKYDMAYFFASPEAPALTARGKVLSTSPLVIQLPLAEQLTATEGKLRGVLTVPDPENGSVAAAEIVWTLEELKAGAAVAVAAPSSGAVADGGFTLAKGSFAQANGEAGMGGRSVLGLIVLAFIGGLILNVMPCVLPVISLKVFGLVRQAGEAPGRVMLLGFVYTLGVWVSFLVLGGLIIALRSFGQQAGWAFQFQSPLFNYAMLILLTVFAMSLFGLFEVTLPDAVQDGAQHALGREGVGGAFLGGAFSTLLATPCMAPFLGPIVGFSLSLHPIPMLALFSVIALGLASPFLVLSLNPRWTRFLPKPGEWMVAFKQLVGFAMLAAALYPLSILISMTEGTRASAQGTVIVLGMMMMSLGLAAYLWGRFGGLEASPVRRRTVRTSVLVAIIGLHLGMVQPALGRLSEPASKEIAWVPFTDAELERRLIAGETVFMDFTAAWCINCKWNEEWVIDTDPVRAFFDRGDVTPMKADWTKRNDEITRMLERFGRAGVPLYVIFPAGKPNEPIVLPEILTQDGLVAALKSATL